MSYELTTLPSGLRVATERLPGVATATVSVNVAVGSRDEAAKDQGLAHLLEHMAFKGTAKRDAKTLAEAFDEIGGQNNAYTAAEQTVYYAKVLAEDVGTATAILGEILTQSLFTEEELERERDVVLQEIAMHRDQPEEYAGDKFQETAFDHQPLGRSILGTEDHIEAFTRADLTGWMDAGYAPEKIIVAAAGDVDHAALVRSVEGAFGGLSAASGQTREAARYTGGDWRQSHDLEQAHLYLGLPSMALYDTDYCALKLLNTILGGGISSRLFQEVREKRGLAYTVQSFVSSYSDCGTLGIYSATSGDDLAELVSVVAGQLHDLATGVDERELARAKKQHLAHLAMARESTSAVSEWMARHLMLYGEYRELPRLLADTRAVTTDDIVRVAGRLLGGPVTVAAYGPVAHLPEHEIIAAHFAA